MSAARFVDTNVLLYSIATTPADKRDVAVAILAQDDLALSVQVLQEFFTQATRPSRPRPLSHELALGLVETWTRFPVQVQTLALLRASVATSGRFQLSYWDAAIIEAARLQGCTTVLSEDLSHGQNYGGVRVVNPFK